MSASTASHQPRRRIHHVVLSHAKRPHGIVIIGVLLFIAAWLGWTMFFAPYATT